MKTLIYILLFSILSISQGLWAQQQDPKAKTILDQVNAKYKKMDAFKAKFLYNMSSPTAGVNETFEGEIVVKDDMFYLQLPDQHVITDGKTQWTYLQDSKEVNVTEYDPAEEEITPNKIYSIYDKGFKFVFVEERTEQGQVYEIIDLVPEDREVNYYKIRLKIVKSSKSIKSWEIFEKNANRYLYNITYFATVKVGKGYFRYNAKKYPNDVEVVDLR